MEIHNDNSMNSFVSHSATEMFQRNNNPSYISASKTQIHSANKSQFNPFSNPEMVGRENFPPFTPMFKKTSPSAMEEDEEEEEEEEEQNEQNDNEEHEVGIGEDAFQFYEGEQHMNSVHYDESFQFGENQPQDADPVSELASLQITNNNSFSPLLQNQEQLQDTNNPFTNNQDADDSYFENKMETPSKGIPPNAQKIPPLYMETPQKEHVVDSSLKETREIACQTPISLSPEAVLSFLLSFFSQKILKISLSFKILMSIIGKIQGKVVEMNVLTRILSETDFSGIQNNISSSFQIQNNTPISFQQNNISASFQQSSLNNISASFQNLQKPTPLRKAVPSNPMSSEDDDFAKFNNPANAPSAIKAPMSSNSNIPAFLSPIKPKSQTPSAIITEEEEDNEEEEKNVNIDTPYFKYSISPTQNAETHNSSNNLKNADPFSNSGGKYLNNSSLGTNKSGVSEFESMLRRGEQQVQMEKKPKHFLSSNKNEMSIENEENSLNFDVSVAELEEFEEEEQKTQNFLTKKPKINQKPSNSKLKKSSMIRIEEQVSEIEKK